MTTTILDVMSDFTSIRTLGSISRCSKLANQTTKQLIDRKTRSAQEMRQLVLDIFPTIKNLPEAEYVESAACYRRLLETFFMETATRNLILVSHSIGTILDIWTHEPDEQQISKILEEEMGSFSGRKIILEAVAGWRRIGWPYSHSRRLRIISDIARQDYSVLSDFTGLFLGFTGDGNY